MIRAFVLALALPVLAAGQAMSQEGPLRIEITEGVIEPLPFALPAFVAQSPEARDLAIDVARIVVSDLEGTGLFREIPQSAHIGRISDVAAPVEFSEWRAINAQALIAGAVDLGPGGRVSVGFRLHDVFAGSELGRGVRLEGDQANWRRIAHRVADQIYTRLTGETAYFDSRVAFVAETGPKDARRKQLAIMDYDGADPTALTGDDAIVIAPRFSPDGARVLFTSYASGYPRIQLMDLRTGGVRVLERQDGTMSFAPRFSPDGRTIVYSLARGGNTDLYTMDIAGGSRRRLTRAPSIETAPSFSPDGAWIVFESDRSGTPQIYIMPASGGEARRISFGRGRYGTPVWSPRGDMVAFTKQERGRFHIGVMRADGSEERLLTASFLDEGPSWSPNGRVIMFTRETQGEKGQAALYSVDLSGRNLRRVATRTGASDPSWSPLRK